MSWIISIVAVMGGFLMWGMFAWKTKVPGGGSVAGQFDFGRYKARELSQRGLFDKTRWH